MSPSQTLYRNLEHQHQVIGFTTDLAFAWWVAEHGQGLTAGFPVDDRVQFDQRIALIEPGIASIQVEQSELWHPIVLIWRVLVFYIKMGVFRGALITVLKAGNIHEARKYEPECEDTRPPIA